MVTMVFGDPAFDVFFTLLDSDDLRGAGLAGTDIGCVGECPRACAFLVDADQCLLDDLDVFRLDAQIAQRRRLDQLFVAGADVFDVIDDVRFEHHAVVGQRCRG